ncbi:Flavin-dependent oxidoreductase, luciferase family (includes alkanesulfonate monooxygenase SsuD and methylene tetrahydromethanopterin reductase) [Actinoplanes philippinensis]|uniref:Flavin-dependent oxidoreductase, luciferase family (Includes alkanesulfonate monooxygenase SsuD and methylene tetrahydromethanopterin reductase) n=2 Tax=Actinoplanes philippinensis TaxID=35752 RepID=A0A1I2HXZ0_9ACTN|nr:LLM class flavin-dependent oxidoreductase [Actinoplanes philippinensis]SFF35005.1 Flavin-dependent oxidoreductase, luciferase family (includes alkanesulfonate monooxygenase SsuD and methylene tetrahydromethanopterin reductase) [Actinoplanes philippinensis]
MVAGMRLSIWPTAAQPYADILEVAAHAAATGWDGVWIADHFMANKPVGEPVDLPVLEAGSLVAALGAAVPRVRIGTLVYGNTYRHPAVVANMAATVDHITGGRFVLGVGAGWQVNEHAQYGIGLPPVSELLDRFVEALQVLRGLLRTPVTTFHGEHYRLTDATCDPKPVQDPLPILIGAKGEKRMLKVVAEYADEWNTWGLPELIAHKSRVLDEHCATVGRDPGAVKRTAQALVVVDGPVPADLTAPVYGGSRAAIAAAVEGYRELGLDELIIPDGLLGKGAAKLKALDTIRSIVTTF